MIQGGLSRRYAKGLFLLALESGREEEAAEELDRLTAGYENTVLASVLNNPGFEATDRKTILLEVGGRLQLSPIVIHFACLLLDRGRLPLLPSIASYYRLLLDEAKGRVRARLVTARPLEESMREKFRYALKDVSAKEVLLSAETDPGLMGGAIVEIEGTIYDGSVRTYLEKMTERLEQGS